MNVGALLRTAYFLKCEKVVICTKNSSPLSPTVSKASAGALELMDIYSVRNLMRFLDKSKENGWQVVGTALNKDSINISDMKLDKPTILVLGNEGRGIRTNILNRCDILVKVIYLQNLFVIHFHFAKVLFPQVLGDSDATQLGDSVVDSLNVSVTGGIMMHHILTGGMKSKKN